MTSTTKIGTHKTKVFEEDGFRKVIYHETCIVKWNDEEIILDSGGFRPDPEAGWSLLYSYDRDYTNLEVIEEFDTRAQAQEILEDYRRNTTSGSYQIKRTSINGKIGGGQTTRRRMNQTSAQYLLGFSVWQEQLKWYVGFNGKTLNFSDKMTINRDTGEVTNA